MVETLQRLEHQSTARARAQVGINVLTTQVRKLEGTQTAAVSGVAETSEQRALRVNQGILFLSGSNADFPIPASTKQSHEGNAEPDKQLLITLGLNELGKPESEFPMLGRRAEITHIVSLKGDLVTCLVDVPTEGGLGGQSGIEVTLKREAVVASQVAAEPEAVKTFLTSLPEGPQKKALQLYLESLNGKLQLSEPEQQAVIVEAARASGLPISEDILAGIASQIGEKPTTPHEKWEAAKKSAEASGNPFTDPEPPAELSEEDQQKYQEDLKNYEANRLAVEAELSRAKAILGDQIVPDAFSLTNLYRPQEASLKLVAGDLAQAEEKLSGVEAEIKDWERIVSTGKVPARDPQTQQVILDNITGQPVLVDYQGSKGEAKEELKRLRLRRDYLQKEVDLAKEASKGSVDSVLIECFSNYLNGEMKAEEAQQVTESLSTGNIDGLIDYLDKLKHKRYLDESGKVIEGFQSEYESLETSIRRLSNLKRYGKGAAVGMAALVVMMVMQGLGAGGGGQPG